jgi:hypothetical protein
VTPDFLVNGRIAVEARILNQHFVDNGNAEGLEVARIPLQRMIEKLLRSVTPASYQASWFVAFRFSRPVGDFKALGKQVRDELEQFAQQPVKQNTTIQISDHFELEFMGEGEHYATFYKLGSYSDKESGGWVLSELVRNLQIAIAEKEAKTAPYRSKYPEWWLVLPDFIDYGLQDPIDQKQFRELPALVHTFDKIILVNPENPSKSFDIYPRGRL